MKNSIAKYFLQILLIVFSVVLGLYLSERIEDRKNEKEALKLKLKVKSELQSNFNLLNDWVPYHREVIKVLDSLSEDEKFIQDFIADKTKLHALFSRNTIMGETPISDAWDIAKSHPLIVNFDYDELLALSRIYNQQKMTYEPIHKLIELLLSPEFNEKESARQNLILFKNKFGDIISREIQLLAYYNNADEILNYKNE